LIINLYELNIGELFEVKYEWTRDVVKSSIRLTGTYKINVCNAIGKFKLFITGKTIVDQSQAFITLHITGTGEEFVQDTANQILCRWNKTRHRDLIWQFAINEPFVICEINVHFHIQRRARWRRRVCGGGRMSRCIGGSKCWRV